MDAEVRAERCVAPATDPARTDDRTIRNEKAFGVTPGATAAPTTALQTDEFCRARGISDNESANGRRDDQAPASHQIYVPIRESSSTDQAQRSGQEEEVVMSDNRARDSGRAHRILPQRRMDNSHDRCTTIRHGTT
jgi:hypothetical protein